MSLNETSIMNYRIAVSVVKGMRLSAETEALLCTILRAKYGISSCSIFAA